MTKVDHIKTRTRGLVAEQIDRRATIAGELLQGRVDDLRALGGALHEQGLDSTAGIVDFAAERLNVASSYLTQTDGDRMIHDLENLARRHALVTGAIGLVLGLGAARVLKASAAERYRAYGESSAT